MKKTKLNKEILPDEDDMLEHYDFDYSKAKPNRFAPILAEQEGYIKLQPDIQKVFKNSDDVNNFLRSIIKNYPKPRMTSIKSL